VGVELVHEDRQTDRNDKANSCLSQFFEGALKRPTAHDYKGIEYASYSFKQVNLIVRVMIGKCVGYNGNNLSN
jgi:hypothetical protein